MNDRREIRTRLPVLVGRAEDQSDFVIDLADQVHTLLQGSTRSGKSACGYTLLGQVVDDSRVLLAGIDPTGLVFKALHGLPGEHLRASGSNPEQYLRVMRDIVQMMDERLELLSESGKDQIVEFSKKLPLTLVVIEEYPAIMALARSSDEESGARSGHRLAPKIERLFIRIAAEGGKVGLRLWVTTQRADATQLGGSGFARSQFLRRVTLRVDSGVSVQLLHDDPEPELVSQVREFEAGRALFEEPGVSRQVIRFDYTSYQSYRNAVDDVSTEGACRRLKRPTSQEGLLIGSPAHGTDTDAVTAADFGDEYPAEGLTADDICGCQG